MNLIIPKYDEENVRKGDLRSNLISFYMYRDKEKKWNENL